jgi:DNA polymerase-3 subunit epsilon
VLDFETTGLNAGADRVVELSVVRVEPGCDPELVLDTLVNPRRPVAATEIHGITDADVADAPTFEEVAGELVRSLRASVVAAYNVYFDMRFLAYELGLARAECDPPHLCLMYARPMLDLGPRCCLEDACREHGVEHPASHQTALDAVAAARLWMVYREAARARGVRTFGDLALRKPYKFTESFTRDPIQPGAAAGLRGSGQRKPRSSPAGVFLTPHKPPQLSTEDRLHSYWEGLKAVMSDLAVTDEEVSYLARKRVDLALTDEQVRGIHARFYAGLLSRFAEDGVLDHHEADRLGRVYRCLGRLGWAPGQ